MDPYIHAMWPHLVLDADILQGTHTQLLGQAGQQALWVAVGRRHSQVQRYGMKRDMLRLWEAATASTDTRQ